MSQKPENRPANYHKSKKLRIRKINFSENHNKKVNLYKDVMCMQYIDGFDSVPTVI